jgi:hypothetical protein
MLETAANCHLWREPDSRKAVLGSLEHITTYAQDVHAARWLARCRTCGQLYFCDWEERVSYGGDQDQQDEVLIPVADAEEALALSQQSKPAHGNRPALVMIFPPADAKPYWVNRV